MVAQGLTMLGRGVPLVLLEAVRREAWGNGNHHAVSRYLGQDRSSRDDERESVSADEHRRAGVSGEVVLAVDDQRVGLKAQHSDRTSECQVLCSSHPQLVAFGRAGVSHRIGRDTARQGFEQRSSFERGEHLGVVDPARHPDQRAQGDDRDTDAQGSSPRASSHLIDASDTSGAGREELFFNGAGWEAPLHLPDFIAKVI